jgi:RNA polymerase sigma-70 factor (sigma-E family)
VPAALTTRERRQQFEQVVRERGTGLTQLAFCLCRNKEQAEDLCAEAFANAWPRWQAGAVDDLVPYLRLTIVNLCRKAWRRETVSRRHAAELASSHVSGPAPVHDFDLVDAVLRLPPRQRAVVVLRYFEDLSEHETAALLSVSTGTVKSRVSRALTALRSSYEGGPHA